MEFKLIEKLQQLQTCQRDDVTLGIGDDCALLNVPTAFDIATSTDTLVAGVHFFADTDSFDLGHKALAVNLSDLAAMGARPCWVSLALTVPEVDTKWFEQFSRGFLQLAQQYNVQLIGGDLTAGPLSITVQVFGLVPKGQALKRSQANIGDAIYVTGELGAPAYALDLLKQNRTSIPPAALLALHKPIPQLAAGTALLGIANAAIDISDGLLADLKHILDLSHVGAELYVDNIPCAEAVLTNLNRVQALQYALNSGDEYQLCFTVPFMQHTKMQHALDVAEVKYSFIGKITDGAGLCILNADGSEFLVERSGYQHFS